MSGDKECIVCGGKLFKEPLYVHRNMPQCVQNLPDISTLQDDRAVDLELFQCSMCGLIQFDCEPVEYWKDSTRAGERSEALIKMNQDHFRHFIEGFGLQGKKVIEIGAGKGGFLQTLSEMNYNLQLYGVENNEDFVHMANEKLEGTVYSGFLDNRDFHLKGAPFDAFYCFSYPARIVNPNDMFSCVRNNLTEGGYGFVRSISAEYISNGDGFFEVTHDLYAYYSQESLQIMLQQNGFKVLEIWNSMPYVCAIVQKRLPYDMKGKWSKAESKIKEIRDFAEACTKDGRKLAVWCASHYAFTVISVCGIGDRISYIIDNAEFKQGKYAPASHVPIVSPEHFTSEQADTILILSDFYVKEIVHEIRTKISKTVFIYSMNDGGIYKI